MPEYVAIVGYMGSGKTTVGRLLARSLGLDFVDLDRAIAERAGLSIPDIFARHGEERFRDIESLSLLDALKRDAGCVIACGGGTVLRQNNREALRKVPTVFLREDTGTLFARTRGAGRPLRGDSRDEFEIRYRERLPLYREVADVEVDVRGRPPNKVAEEVEQCLRGA